MSLIKLSQVDHKYNGKRMAVALVFDEDSGDLAIVCNCQLAIETAILNEVLREIQDRMDEVLSHSGNLLDMLIEGKIASQWTGVLKAICNETFWPQVETGNIVDADRISNSDLMDYTLIPRGDILVKVQGSIDTSELDDEEEDELEEGSDDSNSEEDEGSEDTNSSDEELSNDKLEESDEGKTEAPVTKDSERYVEASNESKVIDAEVKTKTKEDDDTGKDETSLIHVTDDGNINCTDCIDCYNCSNCHGCVGCTNCDSCVDCYNCKNCVSCSDSSNLTNCVECTTCMNCKHSDHLSTCMNCKASSNVNNSKDLLYNKSQKIK